MCLILSLSTVAFAANRFTDISNSRYKTAIEALYELDVVDGYSATKFGPNNTLTRAESAQLFVNALYADKMVKFNVIDFTDVNDEWFYDAVNTAVYYDLVHGMGHNLFCPNDDVTVDQFITMVLNALGYNAPELAGSWPSNVQKIAKRLGLYDNLPKSVDGSDAITRGQACQVIYNALDCYCVEYNSRNHIVETGVTLLEKIGGEVAKPECPANKPSSKPSSKPSDTDSDVITGPTEDGFNPDVSAGQIYGTVYHVEDWTYGDENYPGFIVTLENGGTEYKVGGVTASVYVDVDGTEYKDVTVYSDDLLNCEIWLSMTFEGSNIYRIDKVVCKEAHDPVIGDGVANPILPGMPPVVD